MTKSISRNAPHLASSPLMINGVVFNSEMFFALALGADSVGMAGQIIYSLKKEGVTKTIKNL